MDTPEQVAPQKKRGRKPKSQTQTVEAGSPLGEDQARWAKEAREEHDRNPVVEKYYELVGTKLRLVKVKKSGRKISEFVGNVAEVRDASVEYKERRAQLLKQIERLEADGRLKRR